MDKMLRTCFIFLIILILGPEIAAQESQRIAGELIVRLENGVVPDDFLKTFSTATSRQPTAVPLRYDRSVGRRFNIHVFRYDPVQSDGELLLQRLRRDRKVAAAQFNYRLEWRDEVVPNDPEYLEQWTLPRIGLPQVWEVATGGKTALDAEIVVAVLDSGFDLDHEDIKDNVWNNSGEVPGDGIDNDGNGYIDDVVGWNFVASTPVHPLSEHGNSVAGIIGARGDNGTGVTGINWNVKLMLLTVSQVDQIIEAYEYALDQRERYNLSQGLEGSLVVATNASFGVSKTFCSEQPVWGGMYDLLGEVGVLSVGGADNSAWDVDEVGDMPTTCTSDFLLTVLNTDIDDVRYQSSAWGPVSIDMGAPGQNSFTTKLEDRYGLFTGNSAAVPHLTGTIGLLYSLPCEGLAEGVLTQPQQTALFLREVLLEGVDPLVDLEGLTVTGGRLNVFNTMELIQAQCGGTTGPLALLNLFPNPADESMKVLYETPDFEPYDIEVFNPLGQLIYREEVVPSRFSTKTYELPTAQWPIGVYYLSVRRDKERVTKTFVIQR